MRSPAFSSPSRPYYVIVFPSARYRSAESFSSSSIHGPDRHRFIDASAAGVRADPAFPLSLDLTLPVLDVRDFDPELTVTMDFFRPEIGWNPLSGRL